MAILETIGDLMKTASWQTGVLRMNKEQTVIIRKEFCRWQIRMREWTEVVHIYSTSLESHEIVEETSESGATVD